MLKRVFFADLEVACKLLLYAILMLVSQTIYIDRETQGKAGGRGTLQKPQKPEMNNKK